MRHSHTAREKMGLSPDCAKRSRGCRNAALSFFLLYQTKERTSLKVKIIVEQMIVVHFLLLTQNKVNRKKRVPAKTVPTLVVVGIVTSPNRGGDFNIRWSVYDGRNSRNRLFRFLKKTVEGGRDSVFARDCRTWLECKGSFAFSQYDGSVPKSSHGFPGVPFPQSRSSLRKQKISTPVFLSASSAFSRLYLRIESAFPKLAVREQRWWWNAMWVVRFSPPGAIGDKGF